MPIQPICLRRTLQPALGSWFVASGEPQRHLKDQRSRKIGPYTPHPMNYNPKTYICVCKPYPTVIPIQYMGNIHPCKGHLILKEGQLEPSSLFAVVTSSGYNGNRTRGFSQCAHTLQRTFPRLPSTQIVALKGS